MSNCGSVITSVLIALVAIVVGILCVSRGYTILSVVVALIAIGNIAIAVVQGVDKR